jgi:hypothetical protein
MIYLVPVVVFPVVLVLMLGVYWLATREPELVPGPRFVPVLPEPYGPFPVDTGPLLIVSEALAANDALEREVKAMVREAYRKIGPVR